ncbi:MAG: HD domain-containing phosphohydrolase [Candidatus Eisenbacteria bacterium]
MKYRADAYAIVITLAASVFLAVSFRVFLATVRSDPRGIAVWFALLVAAGVLTYVTLRGGGAVTGTAVVNFAVIITFGGEVAAWLAAIEMLFLTRVLLKFGTLRSFFNMSQIAISLGLAGLVYRATGGAGLAMLGDNPWVVARAVPPLVLCHLTYFAANTGLVTVWSSLKQKRPLAAVWKAGYLWMLPQSFAAPVVGVAIAYLYVRASLWLVAIFFLWLVYYARSSKTNLELQHSQSETVRALASIVDSSTPFLGGESERVARLATELGRKMGITGRRLRALEYAALLHDIGYLSVGTRVLSKTESLAPDEWAAVRKHSEMGASIVGRVKGLKHASTIVLAHHERPDGRGYPRGLRQDRIPKAASILKIADAFVAMTTTRPYRRAMTASEALQRIEAGAGSQFDNDVTDALAALQASSQLKEYVAGEIEAAA